MRLAGAEQVLLEDAYALDAEAVRGAEPHVHACAPLVVRRHHYVPGAVRLRYAEDVDAGQELVAAQQPLRLVQQEAVVAAARTEQQLAADHPLPGADVQRIRRAVGPQEALVEIRVRRVEDRLVVDEDVADDALRARGRWRRRGRIGRLLRPQRRSVQREDDRNQIAGTHWLSIEAPAAELKAWQAYGQSTGRCPGPLANRSGGIRRA
jgi:hypothetical protein